MAEAFGIAAGILQVASFGAEVEGVLLTCASKIRHANKQLSALAGEVNATSKSLEAVGTFLEQPQTKTLHDGYTAQLYRDARNVSKAVMRSLRSYKAKSGLTRIRLIRINFGSRWVRDLGGP